MTSPGGMDSISRLCSWCDLLTQARGLLCTLTTDCIQLNRCPLHCGLLLTGRGRGGGGAPFFFPCLKYEVGYTLALIHRTLRKKKAFRDKAF